MVKEALDTGDEEEKEKVEELKAAFEQLTEWLEDVLGASRQLPSRTPTAVLDRIKAYRS